MAQADHAGSQPPGGLRHHTRLVRDGPGTSAYLAAVGRPTISVQHPKRPQTAQDHRVKCCPLQIRTKIDLAHYILERGPELALMPNSGRCESEYLCALLYADNGGERLFAQRLPCDGGSLPALRSRQLRTCLTTRPVLVGGPVPAGGGMTVPRSMRSISGMVSGIRPISRQISQMFWMLPGPGTAVGMVLGGVHCVPPNALG
jgi:hypothetical protein